MIGRRRLEAGSLQLAVYRWQFAVSSGKFLGLSVLCRGAGGLFLVFRSQGWLRYSAGRDARATWCFKSAVCS
jgi:hypothetical protein